VVDGGSSSDAQPRAGTLAIPIQTPCATLSLTHDGTGLAKDCLNPICAGSAPALFLIAESTEFPRNVAVIAIDVCVAKRVTA
jgi:hypothetical protein